MNRVSYPAAVDLGREAAAEDSVDLREIGRKLWRRKSIILGTVILLTAIAFLIIQQLTPRYTASTMVLVGARESNVANMTEVLTSLTGDNPTILSEIQVIRSRDVAGRVVRDLNLAADPEFNAALRPERSMFAFLNPALYLPPEWLAIIRGTTPPSTLTEEQEQALQEQGIVDAFLGGLNARQVPGSRVIEVTFESEDPQKSARIANAVADAYIVAQLDAKFDAAQKATMWLSERVGDLRQQVMEAEDAVEQFRNQSNLLRAGSDTTIASQQVAELSTQLVAAQGLQVQARARLQGTESLLQSGIGAGASSDALQSPVIQSLLRQRADLEAQAAQMAQNYGERHPEMQALRAQVNEIQANLRAETARLVESLRNEANVADSRVASLSAALDAAKIEVAQLNSADVQLRALEREAEARRALLEQFLTRSGETGVQQDFQQADAVIVSQAAVPQAPSFPKKSLMLALAIMGSGVLGLALAFGVEMIDGGFRSMEQVENATRLRPLGLVPKINGSARLGRSTIEFHRKKPHSAFAESFRSLYTSLLLAGGDKPPKTVLITSSVPKEGKTSVAASLAVAFAGLGRRALLIDCDLRRPTLHRALHRRHKPGLAELLLNEQPLEAVLQKDVVPNVDFIGAGSSSAQPTDLISSERMRTLLASLSESYDCIVIDSAPVLAASETRILSRMVDKTVFVIRWAGTRRETALGALKHLIDADANMAGVLLNLVNVKKHARYGYYDSGYYYGAIRKYYSD